VHADYHAFWLRERRTPVPESLGVFANGLVSLVQPGSICVSTGISSGNVTVIVETSPERPPLPPLDEWDEVVELSFEGISEDLLVTSLFVHLPAELPGLTPYGPVSYRLRVCARGRDVATDMAESGVETYMISSWPEQAGPPVIHKHSDAYGRSLRSQAAPLKGDH
jgi:hypothetical protein